MTFWSSLGCFLLAVLSVQVVYNHKRRLWTTFLPDYSGSLSTASFPQIRLHIPRRSQPYWLTVTFGPTEFLAPTHHVSFTKLSITFHFFPQYFRVTRSSWFSIRFEDDFVLRVFHSTRTPTWVEGLRDNLIRTILGGEILRLARLKTTVIFDVGTQTTAGRRRPTIESDDDGQLEVVEADGDTLGEDCAETRVSASSDQWIMRNDSSRIYSFCTIEAQLRQYWARNRCSLVLIAEQCNWVLVPFESTSHSGLSTIAREIIFFPTLFLRFLVNPMKTADLHINRCDITFDEFRFQDTEIVLQTGARVRQGWMENPERVEELKDAGWTMFRDTVDFLLS